MADISLCHNQSVCSPLSALKLSVIPLFHFFYIPVYSSANDPDSRHFEFDLFMTSTHPKVGKLFFYNHKVIFLPKCNKNVSVRNISYVLLTRLLVSAISDVSEPLRQGCQASTVPAILSCLQSYCLITSPYISSTPFLRTKQRFI